MAKLWMVIFIALLVAISLASGEAKGGRRPRPRPPHPRPPHPPKPRPTFPSIPDIPIPDCPVVGMACNDEEGLTCCAFHKCNPDSNTCEFGV